MNPLNTFLEFDLAFIQGGGSDSNTGIRFQNNVQSIFNRVRILYGSLVIEDINDYNTIVRMLTEHTSTNGDLMDQTSICEGIGGYQTLMAAAPLAKNTRYNFIQGIPLGNTPSTTGVALTALAGTLNPRRYQVNLAAGLFTQDKLIPLKWMASQLAIELYLEDPVSCVVMEAYSSGTQNYQLQQVNMVTEMLEFDSSYDAAFLNGLKGDGVPLKICSWHTFTFANASSTSLNLQIQERSRSVKAVSKIYLFERLLLFSTRVTNSKFSTQLFFLFLSI